MRNSEKVNNEVLMLKSSKVGKILSNHFKVPKSIEIIDKKKHLFTIISKEVNIIIISKVEMRI